MTTLKVADVRLDGGTQPRGGLHEETVTVYTEALERGDQFPPARVVYDGSSYWLIDGFHRIEAAKRANWKEFDFIVETGTLEDAQWRSYAVNATHGLPRTNEDKRRAIRAALLHPQGAGKSNNDIAKHVAVSDKTVGAVRAALEASSEIPKIDARVVQRGGATYTQNTANIGTRANESSEALPPRANLHPSIVLGARVVDRTNRRIAGVVVEIGDRDVTVDVDEGGQAHIPHSHAVPIPASLDIRIGERVLARGRAGVLRYINPRALFAPYEVYINESRSTHRFFARDVLRAGETTTTTAADDGDAAPAPAPALAPNVDIGSIINLGGGLYEVVAVDEDGVIVDSDTTDARHVPFARVRVADGEPISSHKRSILEKLWDAHRYSRKPWLTSLEARIFQNDRARLNTLVEAGYVAEDAAGALQLQPSGWLLLGKQAPQALANLPAPEPGALTVRDMSIRLMNAGVDMTRVVRHERNGNAGTFSVALNTPYAAGIIPERVTDALDNARAKIESLGYIVLAAGADIEPGASAGLGGVSTTTLMVWFCEAAHPLLPELRARGAAEIERVAARDAKSPTPLLVPDSHGNGNGVHIRNVPPSVPPLPAVQPPAQPRKTALEIAAERRAALVSASLRRAPEQVQIVARNLGVDDPDVIDLFADGARNNAGWWEDIAASGFIQLTDETDAVAGSAGYKALREAIDLKARLHRQIAVEARRAEAASRAQSLAAKTYNVILADPPWEYDNKGVNGAAANHYDPMPLPDICALLNNYSFRVAPNAVLFLWTTAPFLRDAFAVIDAWDFTYKTNIVWVKTDLQKPGNGWYTRIHHEHLLVATRGSMTPLVNPSPPLSSVISAAVQEHSRKPDSVHTMLETLYPGCSYLELFARRSRPGWATFGNEIDQKEAAS